MSPDEKSVTQDVAPITAVVISGTGDGGVGLQDKALATTAGRQPNIVVKVVTPLMAIFIRALNMFCTTLLGLVTAGMTPAGAKMLPATDFVHLVVICASLAVATTGVDFLRNLVTLLGKLERDYPLLRV